MSPQTLANTKFRLRPNSTQGFALSGWGTPPQKKNTRRKSVPCKGPWVRPHDQSRLALRAIRNRLALPFACSGAVGRGPRWDGHIPSRARWPPDRCPDTTRRQSCLWLVRSDERRSSFWRPTERSRPGKQGLRGLLRPVAVCHGAHPRQPRGRKPAERSGALHC